MNRQNTINKRDKLVTEFQELLRSGKDYTTHYMYDEAGKCCFLTAKSAGVLIREHYNDSVITEDMLKIISNLANLPHNNKVKEVAEKFSICERESRLILRYAEKKVKYYE